MKHYHFLLFICFFALGCKKDIAPVKQPVKVETNDLQALKAQTVDPATVIKINGVDIPSSAGVFYLPASRYNVSKSYTVTFNPQYIKTITFGGVPVLNNVPFTTNYKVNQEVAVHVVDRLNVIHDTKIIITGMPIVNIRTHAIVGDIAQASFTLIDPEYKIRKGPWSVSSFATLNVRGNTSRAYPKKSYALKTTDEAYEDADLSLLGLREDNSWILDAMYIDQGRMRNRICTDLWNTMNNVPYIAGEPEALNGTRGNMVEVFANGTYLGLYCLTEKLDRKQLKVKKKTGYVYKADNWGSAVLFSGVSPYNNSNLTWDGWELEYPDFEDEDRTPDWKPLYDLVNFVVNGSAADFKTQISQKIDLDNVIDYFIFINAVCAVDNSAKNCFISKYDDKAASKYFFSVWDLDATFGRTWNGVYYQKDDFIFLGLNNHLFGRLLVQNPDDFKRRFRERWNYLKVNQLAKDKINERLKYYVTPAISTGAAAREMARWGNITQSFSSEAMYMGDWYSRHYNALDNYINGINVN